MEIGSKEKAAMEPHFGEVDLENVSTKKLPYGKEAANFNKVFTQQPLIISTFYGKRSYNRIRPTIHQNQTWLDVRIVQY